MPYPPAHQFTIVLPNAGDWTDEAAQGLADHMGMTFPGRRFTAERTGPNRGETRIVPVDVGPDVPENRRRSNPSPEQFSAMVAAIGKFQATSQP